MSSGVVVPSRRCPGCYTPFFIQKLSSASPPRGCTRAILVQYVSEVPQAPQPAKLEPRSTSASGFRRSHQIAHNVFIGASILSVPMELQENRFWIPSLSVPLRCPSPHQNCTGTDPPLTRAASEVRAAARPVPHIALPITGPRCPHCPPGTPRCTGPSGYFPENIG